MDSIRGLDNELVSLSRDIAASKDSAHILELSGRRSTLLDRIRNAYGLRCELCILRTILPLLLDGSNVSVRKLAVYDIVGPKSWAHVVDVHHDADTVSFSLVLGGDVRRVVINDRTPDGHVEVTERGHTVCMSRSDAIVMFDSVSCRRLGIE